MKKWHRSTRIDVDAPPIFRIPVAAAELDPFIKNAIPVIRSDFPAAMLKLMVLEGPPLWLRSSTITVTSEPVVETPPSVEATAPWPWIVTDVVKEADTIVVPLQVQVPDGTEIMSPSTRWASSWLMAACTSLRPQDVAV
jgi:hypothetical protein